MAKHLFAFRIHFPLGKFVSDYKSLFLIFAGIDMHLATEHFFSQPHVCDRDFTLIKDKNVKYL